MVHQITKVGSRCMRRVITSEVSEEWTLALLADPSPKSFSIYIGICMRAERTRPLLSTLRREEQNAEQSGYKYLPKITQSVSVCPPCKRVRTYYWSVFVFRAVHTGPSFSYNWVFMAESNLFFKFNNRKDILV